MLGVAAQFIVMPLITSSWGLRLPDSIILIVSTHMYVRKKMHMYFTSQKTVSQFLEDFEFDSNSSLL